MGKDFTTLVTFGNRNTFNNPKNVPVANFRLVVFLSSPKLNVSQDGNYLMSLNI